MSMAKSLVFFMLFFFIFGQTTPTKLSDSVGEVSDPVEVADASLKVELDELKSKISMLESSLDERIEELNKKEQTIKELDKIVEEKSKSLASLQSQVLSLKETVSLNAKKQEGEAHGRATQIQEQINTLKKEIEAQNKIKDTLETRSNNAERRIQDLNLKLENLHRTNDEQKSRIRKTQRALEVAEEELMKAKMEAAFISKQLMEAQDTWLPAWLSVHFAYCKSFVMTLWNEHGRPCLDLTVKKALETKSELEKWAEPHIDTFKSKWIPLAKEQWLVFLSNLGRHLQSLTTNAIDIYHASKEAMEPRVLRLLEVLDPHFQEAKKLTQPYVDHVSLWMKPHVDKVHVFLKPYTKKVIRIYRKFIRNVSVYRRQLQATLFDLLKGHELTRPFATQEFTSYAASALMVLPFILVFNVISSIFSKKPRKRVRSSHSSHTRRRPKREHPER